MAGLRDRGGGAGAGAGRLPGPDGLSSLLSQALACVPSASTFSVGSHLIVVILRSSPWGPRMPLHL